MDETLQRNVTVRFAHVDGAGIVFYARYIEIIAAAFPELSVADPPFEVELLFHRPNHLGDELTLSYKPTIPRSDWVVSGIKDNQEHFRVTFRTSRIASVHVTGKVAATRTFRTSFPALSNWAIGGNRHMHLSRYYEFVSETVERWFESELGYSFKDLHGNDRLGVPTVALTTYCQALPKLDDPFDMSINTTKVGTCSVQFVSRLESGGRVLVSTNQVIVFVELKNRIYKPVPPPDHVRERLTNSVQEQ